MARPRTPTTRSGSGGDHDTAAPETGRPSPVGADPEATMELRGAVAGEHGVSPSHLRQRAQVMRQLQNDYGNTRVQRLVDHTGATDTVVEGITSPVRPVQVMPVSDVRLQRWKIATLEQNKPDTFKELLARMDGETDPAKRQRMTDLADLTENAGELTKLLDATSGPTKSTTLLNVLKLVSGSSALAVFLRDISPDPAVVGDLLTFETEVGERHNLRQLALKVNDVVVLKGLLTRIKTKQRSADLLDGIRLADSLAGLERLRPLSEDLGTIVALLRKPGIGSGAKLEEFIPLAKDGETLLQLFDLADAATLQLLMSEDANKKATYDVLKSIVSMKVVTKDEPTVSAKPIRFTQNTCTNQGDKYTVKGNIDKLKAGDKKWHVPGDPIRVFKKLSTMNAWGKDGDGHPNRLEDGMIYTLDNRRLYAYRAAARRIPKPVFVPENVIKAERWKFTTGNFGASCKLV